MMKSIYLVLDMQNDLVHPDGASGKGPLGEQVRSREVIASGLHEHLRAFLDENAELHHAIGRQFRFV